MLSSYLNQSAEYQQKTGTDDRGQPIYAAPVSINCRKQEKIQNILTATGQAVQTQHSYYLTTPVKEDDQLEGRRVMAVSVWRGLGGEVLGYKAVV